MKHRELIIAAMDGKTIQHKNCTGPTKWMDFVKDWSAIHCLVLCPDTYEYRIKPEPVPDKVSFGVICNSGTYPEVTVRGWVEQRNGFGRLYTHMVKLTIKTDENGVVTEHVEIVK